MAENKTKKKKKKSSKGSKAFNITFGVVIAVGIMVLLYPTVSDWWNQRHASQAIASYQAKVENIDTSEKDAMFAAAREFNASLGIGLSLTLDEEKTKEYYDILDITGTGIMGYINIPTISVNLPVYHGTEDTILQVAIGHIVGTSFPVGGESTHAVVSGHRGLPSAMLFTDLDKLVEGDIFTITILDEVVTYQVDQIRIVLPEDVSNLAIEEGKDYCTMVTCTPYGVNSHRMLVRGKRIDNIEAAKIYKIEAEATRISPTKVMFGVAVPLTILAGALSLWAEGYTLITRRSHKKILDDLETDASKNAGGTEDEE
ncbi:MAG: class C sortase [Pseudobutyrivibrio sp.]|nr:class C sortase [Pseudobutyrivibrio sp.]